MFGLLTSSLKDFRKTYKRYIAFELIYKLMASFIFVPLIAYVFNRILISMGSGPLLNNEVFRIALNYKGVTGLIIIAMLSVVLIFIEFGVLVVISQKKYFYKDISISDSLITTIKTLPKIFGFGTLHLMLFLLFLIPLIDLPLSSTLIESYELPMFLREKIWGSSLFSVLYVTGLLWAVYLFMRWIFALHFIVLEGKSTKDAITSSLELTKNNRIKILLKLILLNVAFFTLVVSIFSIVGMISTPARVSIRGYSLENYFITFSSLATYIFTLILTPINVIFLTRLYYQSHVMQGLELKDNLKIHHNKRLQKLENLVGGLFRRRRNFVFLILVINLIVMLYLNFAVSENLIYIGRSVSIAGHRGDLHVAPENSLSSVRAAMEKEVDYIEIDVQTTKDGIVILNHDRDLRRVAGVDSLVSDLTYEELSELDIGIGFSHEFIGERIPTLEAVIEEVKGKSKLIIEIKPYGPSEELARKVVEVLEAQDADQDHYIQSFSYEILREVRILNPEIKVGQVMFFAAGDLSTLDLDFYAIEQSMLSKGFIGNARRDEREVWVWTVNLDEDIKEVLRYDIDGIITDYPERVQEIIGIRF
ncbi:glycerophosphoryl diester phosphodiesterase [Alkaliphilus metalliredigens QYMF]|uniref:Glycerophosphoryl diester phosphodiesterase n=1 Tax=Alkaliphilus metalliredigens (strain QYMF) TaxID=293826 RepID=A6TST6_ALKMQ|nr:glycerophosphodiester phosphodiesterase [Alkaliphilus metalliredigens]ABR49254.1 glycerophosphoryl diester phosphodiesterase [Alkaliphilus metalliredigens QYMF]